MLEPLLVLAGVALRLRQYLADRSLWLDEAMLANGLVERTAHDILTAPLPGDQVAPLGTAVLMRWCVEVFGPTERALRLAPLVAGIVAVVAAWRLGHRLFDGRAARVVLVGLVALSPALVYYSAEAKQYGVDAAVTLVLLHLGVRGDGRGWGGLALAGAVAPWLSHPAVFVLAGVGIVYAVAAFRRSGRRALPAVVGLALVWGTSAAVLARLLRATMAGNQIMEQFWRGAFAPFPVRSAAELAWYRGAYDGLIAMAFKMAGAEGPARDLWWPAWLDGVVAVLAVVGLVALVRRPPGRRALALVVVTVVAAVAASIGHRYPLAHRLVVFAVPLVYLLVAAAVDALARVGWPGRLAAAGVAVALVALEVPPAVAVARRPFNRSDLKGALAYVAARAAPGDRLAPTAWTEPALRFYRARYDLERLAPAPAIPPAMDATAWANDLRARRMLGRTWIVVGHRFAERERFLGPARTMAPQLDAWEGDGAGAYLLDFGRLVRPTP